MRRSSTVAVPRRVRCVVAPSTVPRTSRGGGRGSAALGDWEQGALPKPHPPPSPSLSSFHFCLRLRAPLRPPSAYTPPPAADRLGLATRPDAVPDAHLCGARGPSASYVFCCCCGPRLWLGWAQRRPGREGVGSPPLAGGNAWVVAAAWAGGWWAASLTSRRALRVQLFPPLVSLWLCAGLADGRVDSLVALVGPIAGRTGVVQALERLDNSCVLHLTAPNVPQVRLVVKPDALSSVGGYAVLERVCDVFLGFLFIYFASVAQRGASPPTAMPASHTFVCCPGTAYHLLLGNNSR